LSKSCLRSVHLQRIRKQSKRGRRRDYTYVSTISPWSGLLHPHCSLATRKSSAPHLQHHSLPLSAQSQRSPTCLSHGFETSVSAFNRPWILTKAWYLPACIATVAPSETLAWSALSLRFRMLGDHVQTRRNISAAPKCMHSNISRSLETSMPVAKRNMRPPLSDWSDPW
jgi:hypothetical protein